MKRIFLYSTLLLLTAFAGLMILGSLRYGGPEGLMRRAQVALAKPQAPPAQIHVPTPLATATAIPLPPTATATLAPVVVVTATATPVATAATLEPTQALTPAATPSATSAPPDRVALSGFNHAWQTWNNCGPATLAMHLSYFGSTLGQDDIRKALRPHDDDKNVSPEELAAYARSQGYQARVLVNGDFARLRQLLSQGLPVLIETWLVPEPNDGMGHYRLLTGFDDASGEWIAYDSYESDGLKRGEPYRGIRLPYDELANLWKVFNRVHIVVYTAEQEVLLDEILGEDSDEMSMWQRALAGAQTEIAQHPEDAFAWFNLGSDLVALGRHEEAAAAYDQARLLRLPWRMLWYQYGPFQAYMETGRYGEVLALADATIATTRSIEELHYWRGQALQALGDPAAAQASFRAALDLNPHYTPAAAALGH